MRISDWSSDVCSSDLIRRPAPTVPRPTTRPASRGSARRQTRGAGIAGSARATSRQPQSRPPPRHGSPGDPHRTGGYRPAAVARAVPATPAPLVQLPYSRATLTSEPSADLDRPAARRGEAVCRPQVDYDLARDTVTLVGDDRKSTSL